MTLFVVPCGPKRNCPPETICVTANTDAAAVVILKELLVLRLALLKYTVGFPFVSTPVLNVTVPDPVTAFAAFPSPPILVHPVILHHCVLQFVRLLFA